MTQLSRLDSQARHVLERALRLTRLGLVAERATRAFWPLWSVGFVALALMMLGAQDYVSTIVVTVALGLAVSVGVWALLRGLQRFRWPTRQQAMLRLDNSLPGRPILALADQQAIGAGDPASQHVWQAHQQRMSARLGQARPVPADLRLATRDPFGLRYLAFTALITGLLFGSFGQIGTVSIAPQGGAALASGPSWEGWAEPPRYTALPTIYLNDIEDPQLKLPEGTRVLLRLYGDPQDLSVRQEVADAQGDADGIGHSFEIMRPGIVAIDGPGGREWDILMQPDTAPSVSVLEAPHWAADGRMELPFAAQDDFGVVSGQAVIALDLAQVSRTHGLRTQPDARENLILDLPRPLRGDIDDYQEVLVDNLSEHGWATLPVKITLAVQDARGQTGHSDTQSMILPGRRFFDPLARAIIEQRRDLLWARSNGWRVAQVLRAISYQPDQMFRDSADYLKLRAAIRQLEAANTSGLDTSAQDELAKALWDLALEIELGDLDDARERLKRAQERLSEAMRNGASPDEIAELMQELRQATQDYMRQLAEQQGEQDQQLSQMDPNAQTMTEDQLQQMMDQIQQLMEQGRMAEAQMLMDQLMQMMENMQIAQFQGGSMPGGQSMQGLAETLRQQQELSDEAFQNLQDRFSPDGPPGQDQGSAGDQPGQGLAERQETLREELDRQNRQMPGTGGEEGEALRESLDRAGRAMDRAEEKLRQDDLAGALDDQADAMESLRESMRNLGEAMASQQQGQQGQQGASESGSGGAQGKRDPLGRDLSAQGQDGGEGQFRREGLADNRARDLMDEIRRRSTDQTRPEAELDYLRRLMEWF